MDIDKRQQFIDEHNLPQGCINCKGLGFNCYLDCEKSTIDMKLRDEFAAFMDRNFKVRSIKEEW